MIKWWYLHASARAHNPSGADMAKVTGDYAKIYQQGDPIPPGMPVPTHFTPSRVNDDIPLEAEVEASVRRLRLHKAGKHTHLLI